MKFDSVIKAVFAVAALIAAGTYAWNSFVDNAETAQASGSAGLPTKEGFTISTFGDNRQGGFVAVTKYAQNPFEPSEVRQCITFYEIVKSGGDGTAKLYLVGSRCVDYDSGPDLIKFEAEKGYAPADLKDAVEKAVRNKRR